MLTTFWCLLKLGRDCQEINKQHKFDAERFSMKILNGIEVKEQYQVKISSVCNCENIGYNMDMGVWTGFNNILPTRPVLG